MKRLLLGLTALLISTAAFAGTDSNATISFILSQDSGSGQFFVYVSPNITNVPACGSGNPNRFVVDASTPGGQGIIASLLLAYAQARKIDFYGTGNCSVWGDTESARYVIVH